MLQAGYSESIISLATKALLQVIQTYKDDKNQIDKIAEIVWHMLPDILLHYDSNTGSLTIIEFILSSIFKNILIVKFKDIFNYQSYFFVIHIFLLKLISRSILIYDKSILSRFAYAVVAHIEAVLELANITQPHIMPIHLITRSANIIVNIILDKNTDLKFMTLIVTQAYILLVASAVRKSFKGKKKKNMYVFK